MKLFNSPFQSLKLALAVSLLSVSQISVNPCEAQDTPPAARVVSVTGEQVTLDKGRSSGFQRRMIIDLYSSAKVVNLPLTGKDEPIYVTQEVIARMVLLSVSADQSIGELISKPSRKVVTGNVALHNPTLRARNQRPFLRALKPENSAKKPILAKWRERVELNFEYDNESEDDIYFRWKTELVKSAEADTDEALLESGVMVAPLTRNPENTWICPSSKGLYKVTVTAIDSARNKSEETFYLRSTGIESSIKTRVKYRGIAYDQAVIKGVRDVAVDTDGSLVYLISSSGSFLSSGSLQVKIQAESGEITGTYKLAEEHGGATRLVANEFAAYLLDSKNFKVKRFDRGRTKNLGAALTTRPISFGERGVGNGKFAKPVDIAILATGDVAVLDQQTAAIQVFSSRGVFLYSVGMQGPERGQMKSPVALAASPTGPLYCLDSGRRVILQFDKGQYTREFSVAAQGSVTGMAIDPFTNTIGVADTGGRTLLRVNPESGRMISNSIGGPFQPELKRLLELRTCSVVRHDGHSRFLVIDREQKSLVCYSAENTKSPGPNGFVGRLGGIEVGDSLKVASSVDGELGILNTSSKFAYRLDRQGWMTQICGGEDTTGYKLQTPIDIAFDDQGTMYLLDAGKSRVLPVTRDGRILRMIGVAGEGASQLMDCIDMECSGRRRSLLILQERKNNNFHSLSFQGVGQSMSRNDSVDDPVVACVDTQGKFWAIDDDVLGTKNAMGPYRQEGSHEFDEVTDITACIDGSVYVVDFGDYLIRVMQTRKNGDLSIKVGDIKIKQIAKPKDIGCDHYGRFYVYDDSSEKVHWLSD